MPCRPIRKNTGKSFQLSRRDLLRHGANAAMFAAVASQVDFAKPAFANEQKLTGPLNVLAWAGYDDPDLMKGFTRADRRRTQRQGS